MATILEFPVTKQDGARSDAPRNSAPGEIIIFPGVRIERYGVSEDMLPSLGTPHPTASRTKSQA